MLSRYDCNDCSYSADRSRDLKLWYRLPMVQLMDFTLTKITSGMDISAFLRITLVWPIKMPHFDLRIIMFWSA
jgi:hypothetical protein